MAGSMTTFVMDGQTDGQTETDGADYIGPAVRSMRRVEKACSNLRHHKNVIILLTNEIAGSFPNSYYIFL